MPDYSTGQDLERTWRTFIDQHERRWGASCAKKTGYPCEILQPQFKAPLEVPHPYLRMDPTDSRVVKIDYNTWIADIEASYQQWNDSVRKYAVQLGVQGTIQQIIDNPPPEILDLAGPKPTKSTTPVLAAKAGNKWVLGLSTVVPEKAKEFFPELFQTPEIYKVVDPFEEEKPTVDPFAEEVTVAKKVPEEKPKVNGVAKDLGNGFWMVGDLKFPHWASPKDGWKVSSGEYVPRGDLNKEDYRALAQEQERGLHVQE